MTDTAYGTARPTGLRGAVRRVWVSDPMLRLGCIPLDLLAELLWVLGVVERWVQRERARLDG